MDRREPLPAGAELLHAAARARGAAARDLHRLADAQDQGRPVRRHAVRAAGLLAIMALSWIYVLLGQRHASSQGLFFGLKAAVLVIVHRGGAARRPARAQEQRHGRRWPRPPSSRSSSTTCRSRSSCSAPASSATSADAPESQPFLSAGGHGKVGAKQVADREFAAGRGDARARPAQPALVAVDHRGLPGALAGADRRALPDAGRRQRLHQDRDLLQQDGDRDLRRRLCRAGLRRPAGRRQLPLGDGRARCWTAWAWPRRRRAR